MAIGNYGTITPSTVSPNDVQIFYSYTPNRETAPTNALSEISANGVLTPFNNPANATEIFGGLYNLRLPKDIFNQIGVYTLYIKPREIRTTIIDCGVLSALPNVKGIVLDTTRPELQSQSDKLTNGGMVGFNIKYINDDNTLRNNYHTTVTWSNKCESVNQNVGNTQQKAITYRFNDNGTLLFLTLTPSTSPSVKPNEKPFIGKPNQTIVLSNTYFDPIVMEIDLTEHNFDTLGIGIFGEQIRNVQNGKVSFYDKDRNIYKQSILYEIKDERNTPLYEVRETNTTIDTNEDFDTITGDVEEA